MVVVAEDDGSRGSSQVGIDLGMSQRRDEEFEVKKRENRLTCFRFFSFPSVSLPVPISIPSFVIHHFC